MTNENKSTEGARTILPESLMESTLSHVPADDVTVRTPDHFTLPTPGSLNNLAGIAEAGKTEEGTKTTFLSELGKTLLETFLGKHEDEWQKLKETERDKVQCRGRFKFFTNRIAESKMTLDAIRSEVSNFTIQSIPDSIYQARILHGSINALRNPGIVAELVIADAMSKHGPQIIARAEAEHKTLEEQFLKFKADKRTVLKDLGLI